MAKAPGRAATAEEVWRHEERFVECFVPATQRARARACLSHRTRPRQKYRDEWSGFVCHMAYVDESAWRELDPRAARDELRGWHGDAYLMADRGGWDRRIVPIAELLAALDAATAWPELIAVGGDGSRALWVCEDGLFVPR